MSGRTLSIERHNYGEWTKGRFSEVVTSTGPGKLIFLAGVGAEDEVTGEILHKGDFNAQCRLIYSKIQNVLQKNGATLADVVKQVTYVTDVRYQRDAAECRSAAYGNLPRPAHTFLTVSDLAWPGMLVEIDIIAIAPVPE